MAEQNGARRAEAESDIVSSEVRDLVFGLCVCVRPTRCHGSRCLGSTTKRRVA